MLVYGRYCSPLISDLCYIDLYVTFGSLLELQSLDLAVPQELQSVFKHPEKIWKAEIMSVVHLTWPTMPLSY